MQPHFPVASAAQARAFAQRPGKQKPPLPPQSGMPSEVVVYVGQEPVVVDTLVVDVTPQQKPTWSGVSWVSPRLQASRILTPPLKPSRDRFAQKTAASLVVAARMPIASPKAAPRVMRDR